MFNNNRTFGVEIEFIGNAGTVEGAVRRAGVNCSAEIYNHTTRGYWKIVTDGSVMGNGEGLEMVSPPLKGQEGLDELEKVCKAMAEAGVRINKTCGLHVHHDANDFTEKTFKNIIKIYRRFEGTIDTLVSQSRRANANTYCKSLLDNREYGPALMQSDSVMDIISRTPDRYRKLNLKSYTTHGTIEFRQHQGTAEFIKIANWIKLTQAMVERAVTRNVKEGLINDWETFKYFLFLNPSATNRVSSYDNETKEMFKYFNKRRAELAVA